MFQNYLPGNITQYIGNKLCNIDGTCSLCAIRFSEFETNAIWTELFCYEVTYFKFR